jgi:hypothetical protein
MRRMTTTDVRAAVLFVVASLGVASPGCAPKGSVAPAPSASFDLEADFDEPAAFYDFPYPSDLRLDARGAPKFRIPNPEARPQVESLAHAAAERLGFPVLPVAYFRFDGPLAPRASGDVLPALTSSPLWLVDVDPRSPERGRLYPTVAQTLESDAFVPENVLAIAARPGFVLAPRRTYAFVVRANANDAIGRALPASAALTALRDGTTKSPRADAARALYAPLWETLDTLAVDRGSVAAATVFTTGDVVADTAALTDRVLAAHDAAIEDLAIDPIDGKDHDRYCEVRGTITLPQFQEGSPPYNQKGLFAFTAAGDLPAKQRDEKIPLTITLPKGPMPPGGYPLVMYFHGSGGDSREAVDSGPQKVKGGPYGIGTGPSYVVAEHGFAMATSALPISPERVPGAGDFDYLNFGNLAVFRDNFRQGVIEQRLFIRALSRLAIPSAVVAGCAGMSLPAGATAYRLGTDRLLALGLSMGGMYTNLISALEPQIRAAVPAGAGGYWSYFVEVAHPKGISIRGFVQLLFGNARGATFMHPVFHLFETAIEPIEPLVSMPRIARRPLPGHPARSIYEPVGKDDQYFPTPLYDAVALSYAHPQAGDSVWPSMQEALALEGLDGVRAYPLANNLKSADGAPFTGAAVQYAGDGIADPHVIVFQLDAVKYQYGCFFKTFFERGVATIPAPSPLGSPCP